MDIIWKFVAFGIIISIIISTVFGIYSKSTASPYTRTLFGVSSSDLIFGLMVLVIVSTYLRNIFFCSSVRLSYFRWAFVT